MLCTGKRGLWRVCLRAAYTRTLSCASEGQRGSAAPASGQSGDKHTVEGSSASEHVLHYWQSELFRNQRDHSSGGTLDVWSEEGASVRELVNVAVRLRQGKVAAVLPEEVGRSLCLLGVAGTLPVTSKQTACTANIFLVAHDSLAGLVQVLALLMTFYRTLLSVEDKTRFFHLLCRDFGTQRAHSPGSFLIPGRQAIPSASARA